MRPRLSILGFLAVLAGLLAGARPARADGGPFGLGLIVGSPTGLCAKLYLSHGSALDAAVGGALFVNQGMQAHVDYLWHPWVPARERSFDLGVYVGIGSRLLIHDRDDLDNDMHVGVRLPVGVVFDFAKANVPLDAFAEIAPLVDLVVDSQDDGHGPFEPDVNAGLGVRYYF